MRRIYTFLLWLGLLLATHLVRGQQSANAVKFRVGYDAATQTYTAYVVPDYSLPSSNNPDTVERGATAQFTLVVPRDFVISAITDVTGNWDKAPLKLGPGQPNQQGFNAFNLNQALNYYVIGKAPTETNYGRFVANRAVALFTFKGNGCFGPIQPLPANDPFINAADAAFSLNVGNSFYSRSGQPAGGNQVPLEQFVSLTGPPADCRPVLPVRTVTATPDNATTLAGAPTITAVLTNDTNTGGPASVTAVSVSVTVAPPAGTATVNTDGSITYTPPTGFTGVACYTYQICDLTSTTVCATAQVCVTVQPRPVSPASNVDVSVTKTVIGNKVRALNELVTFSIVIKNLSQDPVTNVVVKDSLATGLQFASASATTGSFGGSLLTIPALAGGASTTLTVTARVVTEGVSFNYARVVSQDQPDINAVNNSDQTCVSVPVNLCTGEGVVATVPATFANVQWFRDGVPVGTGNSLTFTSAGTYTFTTSNSTCPAEGCCPLIVTQQSCCPVNACLPFVITKTKSRRF